MSNFRQIDRETGFLMPPSVDEWLPERHLARTSSRAEIPPLGKSQVREIFPAQNPFD
jgi:hypothetical protein